MKKSSYITAGGLIAALYVVLTLVANAFGLASGAIQMRLSEALTVLPYFTPAAIPGLFAGCLVSNLITGGIPADIIVGSVATLLGAIGSYYVRKYKWLVPVPAILANTLLIPPVLKFAYGIPGSYVYFTATVFSGEVLSAGLLGILLLTALSKHVKH